MRNAELFLAALAVLGGCGRESEAPVAMSADEARALAEAGEMIGPRPSSRAPLSEPPTGEGTVASGQR